MKSYRMQDMTFYEVREYLKTNKTITRKILHIDMDAFFASVELLSHPEWRGKPVIVGARPNERGVVSTCSYEARKYGVRSAMPSRTAYQLCPHAIFTPPHMELYSEISNRVFKVFESFTPYVEGVSIDEAFLDVTGALHRYALPISICFMSFHSAMSPLASRVITSSLQLFGSNSRRPRPVSIIMTIVNCLMHSELGSSLILISKSNLVQNH